MKINKGTLFKLNRLKIIGLIGVIIYFMVGILFNLLCQDYIKAQYDELGVVIFDTFPSTSFEVNNIYPAERRTLFEKAVESDVIIKSEADTFKMNDYLERKMWKLDYEGKNGFVFSNSSYKLRINRINDNRYNVMAAYNTFGEWFFFDNKI